jgi:hypothetical protein
MVIGQYDSATGKANTLFGGGSPVTIASPQGSLAAVAVQPDGKAVGAGDIPFVNSAADLGLVRVQVPAPRPYSPITPTRACDTRAGNNTQCTGRTIAANTSQRVHIAGRFGVPADATAAVVNVTAVNPAGTGFLTVYPAGSAVPATSNLNVTPGQVVANLAEVPLSGGDLAVYASITSDVVVDVEGYTAPDAASLYDALAAPVRVCDTRVGNPSNLTGVAAQCNGKRLSANNRQQVQIAGNFGVPSDATAVVANATVVNPATGGFLAAYPDSTSAPSSSNVNFSAGQVIPNRVIVPLANGKVDLYSNSATDVLFDISGYFTATGSGTGYVAEPSPMRICDTRTGNPSGLTGVAAQCNNNPLTSGGTLAVKVAASAFSVPLAATAAVLNVTAINPTLGTFLTVYPGGARPGSSDLNPAPHGIEPNLDVATLSSVGTISIFNNIGTVDLVVDLAGYYTAPGAGS